MLDQRLRESGGREVTLTWPQLRGEHPYGDLSWAVCLSAVLPHPCPSSRRLFIFPFNSLTLFLLLRLSSAKPLAPVIMDGKKPEEEEDDEDKQYVVEEAAPPPPDAPEVDVVSSDPSCEIQ